MTNKIVDSLYNDIDLLRNGKVSELLPKKVGVPKLSTLADRIENNLEKLLELYVYENEEDDNISIDTFKAHRDLLKALYNEISDLTKKHPDSAINSFKATQINRVLIPLRKAMQNEPLISFLELVTNPDDNANGDKPRHTNSDVSFILCQYIEACQDYLQRHHTYDL